MRNSMPAHLSLIRNAAFGVAAALAVSACAPHRTTDQVPLPTQPFVSDVADEEWRTAIPAKGSEVAWPRVLRGKVDPDAQGVLRLGETAVATVALVIRADGTVGLREIVASTNARFTERAIEALRSQVYEPPLLHGSPVAIRGEVSFQSTRTQ